MLSIFMRTTLILLFIIFKKQRVKIDIAHIFFRFDKALSKEHGAFADFIRALRDAMFVMDQQDLDQCLAVLREKYEMTDAAIEKKLKYEFHWFLRRVKRKVPTPSELEERYLQVYDLFKDVVCAKSGKKLFDTKHGRAAHLSCLKHIRRNCLSDIPFVSYYHPIGEDSDGLMLYKFIRGTSALEGLHQKL
jgi:predicted nucleic acid-binding protein